jgi:hypothetical protein
VRLVATIVSLGICGLGLVLSARLLRLALRRRTAPELAMGLYCLFVTCGALLFGLTVRAVESGATAAAFPLSAAATFFLGLAAFVLALGIWRIFRPGERWARALVTGLGVWLAASWAACVLSGRPVLPDDLTLANGAFVAGRLAVYACGAFEAFRYTGMLRRRLALGLADPISAHQILLWGIAWLCVAVVAVGSVVAMMFGGPAIESPVLVLVLSAFNATAWICTWLAFFPPPAYQRWISAAPADAVS